MKEKIRKLKNVFAHYKHANMYRRNFTSLKWRAFIALLLVAVMMLVRDYLSAKYLAEFSQNPLMYLVLDKVYYWFIAGTMLGIAFSWLLYEGEFAIAIWKLARSIENNAFKGLVAKAKTATAAKARKKKR